MQRRYFLSRTVLFLAAVSILPPTAAQAGNRTPPASASRPKAPPANPVVLAPGGLRLRISTRMRDPAVPLRAVAAVAPPLAVAFAPVPPTPAVPTPSADPSMPARQNPYLPALAKVEPLPRLFAPIQVVPSGKAQAENRPGLGSLFGGLVPSIPLLPESGQSILPSIRKVYPTGEKPLVVVSFKCPTEVIGVTPPTIRLLHNLVDMGMEGLNRTDLLSFNLQQVCQ